jgi:hypothetical protein
VGGLIAVAILPALAGITGNSYLQPSQLAGEFRTAMFIAATWCVAGGLASAAGIRNPIPSTPSGPDQGRPVDVEGAGFHCPLEAAPLSAES